MTTLVKSHSSASTTTTNTSKIRCNGPRAIARMPASQRLACAGTKITRSASNIVISKGSQNNDCHSGTNQQQLVELPPSGNSKPKLTRGRMVTGRVNLNPRVVKKRNFSTGQKLSSRTRCPRSLSNSSSSSSSGSKGSSPVSTSSGFSSASNTSLDAPCNQVPDVLPSIRLRKRNASFSYSVKWLSRIPLTGKGEWEPYGQQVHLTAALVHRVGDIFRSPELQGLAEWGGDDGFVDNVGGGTSEEAKPTRKRKDGTEPYSWDIFNHVLAQEPVYENLFKNPASKGSSVGKVDYPRRKAALEWMKDATKNFKYVVETTHLAVFIMDCYLHKKTIRTDQWPLFALVAFLMAVKLEEKDVFRLHEIQHAFPELSKITKEEVRVMEADIFTTLQFKLHPPNAKFLVDAVVHRGGIDFPNDSIKKEVQRLCHKILLESLKQYFHSRVKASTKARLALEIAIEYVMYKHVMECDPSEIRKRYFQNKKRTSSIECFDIFCELLRPVLNRSCSDRIARCS